MTSIPNFLSMSLIAVTICVSEPPVRFVVHKDLICSVAPYFRGAFEHAFKEAEEESIHLTDVSEETFRIFLQWAYAQVQTQLKPAASSGFEKLVRPSSISSPNKDTSDADRQIPSIDVNRVLFDENHEDNCPDSQDDDDYDIYHKDEAWISNYYRMVMSLLKLYIFADKYCIHQLRDDILSALQGRSLSYNWWPDPVPDLVNTAYENLPSSSPFLRLLVFIGSYLYDLPDESSPEMEALKELHPGFLFDWAVVQHKRLRGGLPERSKEAWPDSCVWHEHVNLTRDECRQRLANNIHIFTGLINACEPWKRAG